MIAEVKGLLNFAAMLQLYWDKLSGTDEEPVLAAAFKLFDTANSGAWIWSFKRNLNSRR